MFITINGQQLEINGEDVVLVAGAGMVTPLSPSPLKRRRFMSFKPYNSDFQVIEADFKTESQKFHSIAFGTGELISPSSASASNPYYVGSGEVPASDTQSDTFSAIVESMPGGRSCILGGSRVANLKQDYYIKYHVTETEVDGFNLKPCLYLCSTSATRLTITPAVFISFLPSWSGALLTQGMSENTIANSRGTAVGVGLWANNPSSETKKLANVYFSTSISRWTSDLTGHKPVG